MNRPTPRLRTSDDRLPLHGLQQAFGLGGEMGDRIRRHDWASTPLGPVESWPSSLRTSVGICLTTRFPVVLSWGPDDSLLYNDACAPILGEKHPRALGRPAREVWAEIWPLIGPMFEEVRTGRAAGCADMLLPLERRGYREECYFCFSFSPVPLDDGRVGGLFTAVTETTPRVLRERRLRALQRLGARLPAASSSPEVCARAVSTLVEDRSDAPYAVVYLADGPVARRAAVAGLPDGHPLAPAEAAIDGPAAPWPLARSGPSRRVEAAGPPDAPWPEASTQAFVVPIGRAGWLVGGLSPRLAPDDAYREFFEQVAAQVGAALANLQALEEERRRAETLAGLDRAKTIFFSNVSHEFRTPLTLMLGPVRDALASPERALRGEALEVVGRNATRLLKLVNSLLDFARLEAGRLEASFEPVDVSALTRDLASLFRSAVENAGLRFEVDCAPTPEPAYLDPEMWEKIVLNLLSNAVKFTFEGSIAVRVRDEPEGFLLEVADTGTGIPEADLPRVFERFRRIPGARARSREGSGIGLALVQEFVRLHGGTVEVRSKEGRGTRFRVRIPRGKTHVPDHRLPAPRPDAASAVGVRAYVDEALGWAAKPPSVPAPGPAEARVLVVDDNADMRLYVSALLSRRWRVDTCGDGLQALEEARRSPPDLMLSDVRMPGLDGFALLRKLRADARTRTVPFILLSARAGEESRLEGLEAGADDYLVKPFSAQELTARVESTLRLARLRKENQEALRRSEERFKIAAQSANDLIYDWDLASGRLEWFGDVDGALGYARGEFPRRVEAWSALIHPEDRARVRAAVDRHLHEGAGGLFSEEYRIRTKGGTWRTWNDRGTALRDESGRPVRWYGAVSDITSRRQAEEEILRLNATLEGRVQERTARLQELVRELETFAYTVAHDLRAPLRALRGLSEVLVEDHAARLGESGTDLANRIAAAAERMDALTRDLLDYSRLALAPLELERVDLERVVDRALQEVESDLEERGADVSVERPLPAVQGQEVLLTQALANLLSNAVKFVDPGTTPRVRIVAARLGGQVRLQVSDNGIGIAREHLGKLFGVFERLEPQRFPGTGIGLAIVRKAAERMGGRAGVESRPGHGSTFWIELARVD